MLYCRVSWQRYCRETEAGIHKLYSIFTFSVTASLIVWFLLKAPSKCCKSCIHILLATWYGQGFMDKQCFYWCTTSFSKCSSETSWCVSMFQEITKWISFLLFLSNISRYQCSILWKIWWLGTRYIYIEWSGASLNKLRLIKVFMR